MRMTTIVASVASSRRIRRTGARLPGPAPPPRPEGTTMIGACPGFTARAAATKPCAASRSWLPTGCSASAVTSGCSPEPVPSVASVASSRWASAALTCLNAFIALPRAIPASNERAWAVCRSRRVPAASLTSIA